jgi:pimeloyl-ACP methyl ester carboxylesterase
MGGGTRAENVLWGAQLTMPTTVVLAEADAIVHAPSVARYLQQRMHVPAHVHMVTFPDAGHADVLGRRALRRRLVERIAAHVGPSPGPVAA